MIDTKQTIKINNTPYSTTTLYSGSVVLGEIEYDFTITRTEDNPYVFVDWVEEVPDVTDEKLLEIEKEIEDTFEEMISENE